MKPDLLTLDPFLMQELATQPSNNAMIRTPAQMRALRLQRANAIEDANAITREQRRRDATIKLLKPDEDALRKLRKLEIGNYFCVPYEMAKAIRAMAHREQTAEPKHFATSKFKWGQRHYLKVKRVPEHGET